MRPHRSWLAVTLALGLGLGACRDLPTEGAAAAPAPTPGVRDRTALTCTVQVRARTLSCRIPDLPRGMKSNIILGGQGQHVRLTSSNVSYDGGDQVLSADVTVQNLIDQPLGTNGTDTTGVRVFFNSGPTVTEGSGMVTVLTDSVGTFLAANQPYFKYDGVIPPRSVSAPQLWEFSVDPSVVSFIFQVYVEAEVPVESGVIHFRPERGTQTYFGDLYAVWAASAHDVFALSDGAVVHFDGNYWRALDAAEGCGCGELLYGVWGTSGSDVWVVAEYGTVRHWTGGDWVAQTDSVLGTNDLHGVWGTSNSDLWAVGDAGQIVHYDGGAWTGYQADSVATDALSGVWGSGSSDVWAVGENGTLVHWDGSNWLRQDLGVTYFFTSVWGTSANDVWIAGFEACPCGDGVLFHFDGGSWTQVTDPVLTAQPVYSGWSSGPNDVWAASDGSILHFDGSTWAADTAGIGAPFYGVTGAAGSVFAVGGFGSIVRNTGTGWQSMSIPDFDLLAVWGSSAGNVWAVGQYNFAHNTGSGWVTESAPGPGGFTALWGSGASDIWAVAEGGAIAHYDGVSWTVTDSVPASLYGVWGSSGSDIWAVGDGGLALHYTGSGWAPESAGSDGLQGIWGSGAGDVFAVGENGSIQHWDGAAWTAMNSGTTETLHAVWGAGADTVFAVGSSGTVLYYDGNLSGDWTAVATPAPPGADINGIWGTDASHIFILANEGRTLIFFNGSEWRVMTSFSQNADIRMYGIWGTTDRNLYTVGDMGTILHGQR
jgi:hypothetical protein